MTKLKPGAPEISQQKKMFIFKLISSLDYAVEEGGLTAGALMYSSSSSRNEYYLGGIIALLLHDHRTMSTKSGAPRRKERVPV